MFVVGMQARMLEVSLCTETTDHAGWLIHNIAKLNMKGLSGSKTACRQGQPDAKRMLCTTYLSRISTER
jgi:hypothetical protein